MNPFITIKELKQKLERKEISASEVRSFYTERIKKFNTKLNAVLEVWDAPSILLRPGGFEGQVHFADAKHSGQAGVNTSTKNSTLSGIPGLLKDNICQKGHITSAGSKILANYQAPYNATVTTRLQEAGAQIIGRTNMDEFAMGGSGEFSAYGPTKNPWDAERIPGGSSSGSGAAVAAGLAPFAIGTETGGSVRSPATFCNLVGLRPTYGSISRFGIVPFASSLDCAGPLTRTVYDNALVFSALAGKDANDSSSLQHEQKDYTIGLDGKLPQNLKVGIIREALEAEGIDPEVRTVFDNAVQQLKNMGATVSVIDIPNLKYGIALYMIISRAEAASNLYRYDGTLYGVRSKEAQNLMNMYLNTRHDGFGVEVKRRILVGNYTLSAGHRDAYYDKAQQIRAILRAEFEAVFKSVDVLISPTCPILPWKINSLVDDPMAMWLSDYFLVSNCITGTPALSIQGGFAKNGLPVGFQFFGPSLSEQMLFKVAHAFQENSDYHTKYPKGYE